MRARWAVVLAAALTAGTVFADAGVTVCFNYGCNGSAEVRFSQEQLAAARALLAEAGDAPAERAALARGLAVLYREAGRQSPIAADRGGNYLDGGADGRMDCIDHSTTTTRLLRLLEGDGALRFHRVLEPARRTRFVFQHFSAVIEEAAPVVHPPAPAQPPPVPDHVPLLLALCDCPEVLEDISRPPPALSPASPAGEPGARFAVDSWFVDHGEPAVVLPLPDWLNGEGPNVQ